MEPPTACRPVAAARQSGSVACHDRQGHRRAPEEAGRASRCRRAHGRAPHSNRDRRAYGRRRRQRQRGPPAVVLPRLSAQHQHGRARRFDCHGRHRMSRDGGLDGPFDDVMVADGRRRRFLDGTSAVQQALAHVRQSWRRHLQPLGPARHPAIDQRRRQHHLQDPVQQRGGDDRRTTGRRSTRRAGHDARARGRRSKAHRRGDR